MDFEGSQILSITSSPYLIQQVHESDLFQGFPYNWCADFMHLCQDFGGFPTILGEWETSHSSIWENQHDGPMIWAHGKCPKSIRKTPIPSSIHNWQGLSNAQIWFRFKHFSSTPFGTSKSANKNGNFWTVAAEFQPPTKETTFYCNPRNEGVGIFLRKYLWKSEVSTRQMCVNFRLQPHYI